MSGRPAGMPRDAPDGYTGSVPSRLSEDVQVLAGDIGPRGTGTESEAAAARFVAGRLEALGIRAHMQPLRAVASQNSYPLASGVLAVAAAVLSASGGRVGRWVGAALALSAGPLLGRAIRLSTNPLRHLMPKVPSRNVVARIAPLAAMPRRRVVILAHLDTNRCRLAWQSGTVRWLTPLTWLTLGVFWGQGLLLLAHAVSSRGRRRGPGLLWYVGLGPLAYVLGTLVTLVRDERTPYSPGAHDNAASVAVALGIAAALSAHPLLETEVWLAFTGAEETDHAGLYALLEDRTAETGDALYIGLEGLGSGELSFLTREGLCSPYTPDPGLLAAAVRASETHPELGARPGAMTVEDEVGTLRRLGYRAICIVGRDPGTGALPRWHRRDDTADTISLEFMERACGFLRAFLAELDSEATWQRAGTRTGVGSEGGQR
jgi:hypothetical protein